MSLRPLSKLILIACASLVAVPSLAVATQSTAPKAPTPATDTAKKPDAARPATPYPLGTCPVSGEALGSMGDPVIKVYDGREVRFCCDSCPKKFEADKDKYRAKIDAAIVMDQSPRYPTDASIVSGKKLADAKDGKPLDYVHNYRLVRLLDDAEKTEFLKDAQKYMAALDKAVIEAQGKDYKLTSCPSSGEKLGSMGQAVDVVVAGRLVRLCCSSCRKDIDKDPMKFIAAVDASRDPKATKGAPPAERDGKK